ncbi:MAG: glycosyltransferase family 2 protein [Treponema sp.]|uniref:glycosyltransferase family 2 protein n=1 Tax=Treponema sp. TaxID=166 RepID=UPI0025D60144|nr:glycosyltransferase family 2 protein [Treponema sp.]MBR0497103.1 glycosyltransferase family 2 protein [Treponema sp.]
MSKIDVVITMGGLGSRFRKAGYDVPKYMIEAKGKTLFEWSMISLDGFKDNVNQYIFIAMKDEKSDAESFVNMKCAELEITNFHVILIDYLTDGQATTAMLASKYWKKENALLIYNIDTYVESGAMNSNQIRGAGFIPCFKAEGTHWSFVRLDERGKAVEIREKERISDNCTLGAYYFKTCALYECLYNEYYKDSKNLVNGEKYVAPLYNFLLEKGGDIYIADIPCEKVHVLGTPEELKVFLDK